MRVDVLPPDLADEAVALWRGAGLARPWNDPVADLRRALAGSGATVLAARDGARLVGTIMVGHDGHRGWAYYVAVADDARGRGVGTQLVRAAEAWLAERGIPKLNLMVRDDNAGARRFYERLGYARDDVVVLSRRVRPAGG